MNFRENHMSSKVLPAELIPFFIIGRALSIQTGSVITTNARMNNKKNRKICFEFIKKKEKCSPGKGAFQRFILLLLSFG